MILNYLEIKLVLQTQSKIFFSNNRIKTRIIVYWELNIKMSGNTICQHLKVNELNIQVRKHKNKPKEK